MTGDGKVLVSDALGVLKRAVGQQNPLTCISACGDAIVADGEECDVGTDLENACEKLGFSGGIAVCAAGCTIDTTGCCEKPYLDTGVGSVIDKKTGLEWQKIDKDGGITDVHATTT